MLVSYISKIPGFFYFSRFYVKWTSHHSDLLYLILPLPNLIINLTMLYLYDNACICSWIYHSHMRENTTFFYQILLSGIRHHVSQVELIPATFPSL